MKTKRRVEIRRVVRYQLADGREFPSEGEAIAALKDAARLEQLKGLWDRSPNKAFESEYEYYHLCDDSFPTFVVAHRKELLDILLS